MLHTFLSVYQMAIIGRPRQQRRRVGQAEQQAAAPVLANGESLVTSDNQTLDQVQSELGMDIQGAVSDNGGSTIVITDDATGAQVTLAQAAAQPVPAAQEQCQFPVQSLNLTRTVMVTNSAPQIQSIATDQCGNVIQFVQSMTRTLSGSEWQPAGSLSGNVDDMTDVNGVIQSADLSGVTYANSPAVAAYPAAVQASVVQSQPLVGASKVRSNAGYNPHLPQMVGSLKKYRSA